MAPSALARAALGAGLHSLPQAVQGEYRRPPRYMGKVFGRGQTIFENFLVSEAPSRNSAKTLSNGE